MSAQPPSGRLPKGFMLRFSAVCAGLVLLGAALALLVPVVGLAVCFLVLCVWFPVMWMCLMWPAARYDRWRARQGPRAISPLVRDGDFNFLLYLLRGPRDKNDSAPPPDDRTAGS